MESHLLQMRGLKLRLPPLILWRIVASFTDAWIETEINDINEHVNLSHLLQMRGLKLFIILQIKPLKCRIFYRCVD